MAAKNRITSYLQNCDRHQQVFIMAIENYLSVNIDADTKVSDVALILLYHKGKYVATESIPAKVPLTLYTELLCAKSQPIIKDEDLIGYTTTLGYEMEELMTSVKNMNLWKSGWKSAQNWCQSFNPFDRVEQICTALNMIDYRCFLSSETFYQVMASPLCTLMRHVICKYVSDHKMITSTTVINGYVIGSIIASHFNLPIGPHPKSEGLYTVINGQDVDLLSLIFTTVHL